MKAIIFALFLSLLASCKVVTMDEMKRAESACRAHGGLLYARFFILKTDGPARTVCQDGTEIDRLPKK